MVGIVPSLEVFFRVAINIKDINIFNNDYEQLQQNSKNPLTSSANKNKSLYTFFLTFVD